MLRARLGPRFPRAKHGLTTFGHFTQTEDLFVTRPQSLRPDLIDAALTSARGVGTPLWLYEAEPIRQRSGNCQDSIASASPKS